MTRWVPLGGLVLGMVLGSGPVDVKAQADVLTSGLRANPLLFFDAQRVPYGSNGGGRGGGSSVQNGTEYDININHPLDLNGKRQARLDVACRAKRVLEAQFQDALRV